MKKIIILVLSAIILTSCNKKETVEKFDTTTLKQFDWETRVFIEDMDPDIVSMSYLVKNADKYLSDVFAAQYKYVFVKGTVTDIKITDYSKEDLSIMNKPEMEEVLSQTISYDIYLDNIEEPLSDNISIGEPEPDIEIGKEYYFMVNVSELVGKYSFNVLEIYDID